MLYIIQYLKHLMTATNEHGVHSPFVYDYVTKCLYQKPGYRTSKSRNVLLKSIRYFKMESIRAVSEKDEFLRGLQSELDASFEANPPFDLIYLKNPFREITCNDSEIHNLTMIFIDGIYKNKATQKAWQHLKDKEEFTVSIDLFHCGVLFFRKEQLKEHFKIRI